MDDYNYPSGNLEHIVTKKPYVRCNAGIPKIPKGHQVTICKATWDDRSLMRFKNHHATVCMECAGNSRSSLPYKTEGLCWENGAVANFVWNGTLLRDLIHFIPPGTSEIVFTSLDKEFTRSLPVSAMYETEIMVARGLNGERIPIEHGGPFRLVVPGYYGMASVKWLDNIYLASDPFEGKYQTDKYNYINGDSKLPCTYMFPKSLITSVGFQNPVTIKGKAWSGYPIEKVEMCLDGTWLPTTIVSTTGKYGWVSWEFTATLAKGKHKIASCAYDAKGRKQPEHPPYNLYGYGNNAIQEIEFKL